MISILIERTATEGFCPVGHDGGGVMVDWSYKKGSDYLPSDAEVMKLRPGN